MSANEGECPWPKVKLGDVLNQDREYITKPESRAYKKLSVKLYGKGVVLDAPTDGAELRMQKHQIAHAGQVILSEIWGKKGAIGFVPSEGTGALCTSHFFLFEIRSERIIPGWLDAIFRFNYLANDLDAEAHGTTGYAAIRPKQFLAMQIPLPPLPEQKRIVAKVQSVTSKVNEARELRASADMTSTALCRSLLADGEHAASTPTPMSELVTWRRPDVDVEPTEKYPFAGVYCFGRGVFRGQTKLGSEFAYKKLSRVRAGEFVYPKLMAWEGAFGIVPDECDGRYVSPEFPVFEVNTARVLPEVLDIHFCSPSVWPVLSGASTGTNVRRRRLNPKAFLAYRFPLPPMETQLRCRKVLQKLNGASESRTGTSKALEALTSSVLDKAFKGEL